MRRVSKVKTFGRWSQKAGIRDDLPSKAVDEMTRGVIDADLVGHVFKKRVSVPCRGKQGGARTIVGSNLSDRWFFLYGFENHERDNIEARGRDGFQEIVRALLSMDSKLLEKALREGET